MAPPGIKRGARLSRYRPAGGPPASTTVAVRIASEDDDYVSTTSSSVMTYSSSSQSQMTHLLDPKNNQHDSSTNSDSETTKHRTPGFDYDSKKRLIQQQREDEDESRDDTTRGSYPGAFGEMDSVVGDRISLSDYNLDVGKDLDRMEAKHPMLKLALSSESSALDDAGSSCSRGTYQTTDDMASLATVEQKTFVRFVEEYRALNHNKTKLASPPDLCTTIGCCGHSYEDDTAAEIVPMVVNFDYDEETVEGADDATNGYDWNDNNAAVDDASVGREGEDPRDPPNVIGFKMRRVFSSPRVVSTPPGAAIDRGNPKGSIPDHKRKAGRTWQTRIQKSFSVFGTVRKAIGGGSRLPRKGKHVQESEEVVPQVLQRELDLTANAPAEIEDSKGDVANKAPDDLPNIDRQETIKSTTPSVDEISVDPCAVSYSFLSPVAMSKSRSIVSLPSKVEACGSAANLLEDTATEVKQLMTDSGNYAYLVMRELDLQSEAQDDATTANNTSAGGMSHSSAQPPSVVTMDKDATMERSPSNISIASTGSVVFAKLNDDGYFPTRVESSSFGSFARTISNALKGNGEKEMDIPDSDHENDWKGEGVDVSTIETATDGQELEDVDTTKGEEPHLEHVENLKDERQPQDTTDTTEEMDKTEEIEIELEEEIKQRILDLQLTVSTEFGGKDCLLQQERGRDAEIAGAVDHGQNKKRKWWPLLRKKPKKNADDSM
jgi:hypothetical protein